MIGISIFVYLYKDLVQLYNLIKIFFLLLQKKLKYFLIIIYKLLLKIKPNIKLS